VEDEADRKPDEIPFHRLVETEGFDAMKTSEVGVQADTLVVYPSDALV